MGRATFGGRWGMEHAVGGEYLRDSAATFRKYKVMADTALSRVSDEQFFAALDEEANSLAVLVKHMAGNLRSRWTDPLTSDGEKPDRDRDGEFEIRADDSREALLEAWEGGWALVFRSVDALTPAHLERTVSIRGEPHSLTQALNRQMTHAAYHVGQVVLLAKHFRSGAWESLSIPRGESREFNAAMRAGGKARGQKPDSVECGGGSKWTVLTEGDGGSILGVGSAFAEISACLRSQSSLGGGGPFRNFSGWESWGFCPRAASNSSTARCSRETSSTRRAVGAMRTCCG
jgi:hypothetical protein